MLRMFHVYVELDKYLDALHERESMFSYKDFSNAMIGRETLDYQFSVLQGDTSLS